MNVDLSLAAVLMSGPGSIRGSWQCSSWVPRRCVGSLGRELRAPARERAGGTVEQVVDPELRQSARIAPNIAIRQSTYPPGRCSASVER
jgi:hypothetical protein